MVSDFDRLLTDAKLVAEQATLSGRLAEDSALPRAITSVERAKQAGRTPDYSALMSALSSGVRAIDPITLIDLREGRSPLDARGRSYARGMVALLCAVSVILTGLIGWYTAALFKAESALAAIQQLETRRYVDKVREVRRLAQDEEVFSKRDARYSHYHQQLGDLAVARAAHNAAVGLIIETAQSDVYPFEIDVVALASRAADAISGRPAQAATSETVPPPEHATQTSDDLCATAPARIAAAGKDAGPNVDSPVPTPKSDLAADYCFLLSIGDDNPGMVYRPTTGPQYAFAIGSRRMVYSGWILPFLYGLLGASVFLMRSLLNEKTANLAFFPVLLRLALGGIAGLVIGWFSVPGAAANVTSISSIPFGIAFLAGFSIDTLFALLERLAQSLSGPQRREAARVG